MLADQEATNACGVCGTAASADARFCKACGGALRAPPKCPACATAIPEGARFCPGCGARMVGARPGRDELAGPPESLPRPPEPEPEPAAQSAASAAPPATPEPPPPSSAAALAEADALAEIEAAARRAPKKAAASGIVGNLFVFAALLVVILVVIREMNEGAPKEVSPFEAPPPSSTVTPRPAGSDEGSAAAAGPTVRGTVQLGPEIGTPPQGVLYVILRMQGAPDRGPPIAVKRIDRPKFPAAFSIGPGDVMQPGLPFEGPFDVRARLDSDGNAMTKTPGDLFSETAAAGRPGDQDPLEVVLDSRIQ